MTPFLSVNGLSLQKEESFAHSLLAPVMEDSNEQLDSLWSIAHEVRLDRFSLSDLL